MTKRLKTEKTENQGTVPALIPSPSASSTLGPFKGMMDSNSNYGTWGKKRKNVDWTDKETLKFYKGLSVFGTDFSMMESVFKRR